MLKTTSSILGSFARHFLTLGAGGVAISGNPKMGAIGFTLVMIWSILEKVKVKKMVDGYEITIAQAKKGTQDAGTKEQSVYP